MNASCANIDALERNMLSSYHLELCHFHTYIDDILFFFLSAHIGWKISKTLNQTSTNFTAPWNSQYKFSATSFPFLDMPVHLNNNHLSPSLYTKCTDDHSCLNLNSHHPTNLKISIIYRLYLRSNRVFSHNKDYKKHIGQLYNYFLNRNYPLKIIKH